MTRIIARLLILLSFPLLSQFANAQLGYRSMFGIHKSVLAPGVLYLSITGNMANHIKIYDPTTKSYIAKPSSVVFNDVSLNNIIAYGLTQRLTLFTEIPLRSVHLYSLNPTLTGKGFGDIGVGGSLNVLNDEIGSSLDATLSITLPVAADTPPRTSEYPLGIQAIRFTLSLEGYNHIGPYGLHYSSYYNLVGTDGTVNYGDWTGAYLLFDKYSKTPFGDFSFEAGVNVAYKFDDKISGNAVSGSSDYYLNALAGITYYYSHSLDIRLGVPCTIYQKKAWFTSYSILIGLEYQVGL